MGNAISTAAAIEDSRHGGDGVEHVAAHAEASAARARRTTLRPESAMNRPGSIVISSRAPWADLRQRKQTVYDSIDAQHRRKGSL
ncbi:hypothetical protein [Saccharopolyspora sp. NPDC050642]|uniref:hypothetical protein n=1 Tax=Saccharopolyspora sp. NPDC050642 TaxID=3157099 RepID=UPI00340EFFDC